jgi:hypothetical protein
MVRWPKTCSHGWQILKCCVRLYCWFIWYNTTAWSRIQLSNKICWLNKKFRRNIFLNLSSPKEWVTAALYLGLWVLIPPAAWLSVSCECCVLSLRGPYHYSSGFLRNMVSESGGRTSQKGSRPSRAVQPWEKHQMCNLNTRKNDSTLTMT